MKKLLSMLAIAAMMLSLTACGDDDDDKDQTIVFNYQTLSTIVAQGDDVLNTLNISANVEVNTTKREFEIELFGLRLGNTNLNLELDDLPYKALNNQAITFSGSASDEGHSITDITGQMDFTTGQLYLHFTVDRTYEVTVTYPSHYTVLTGNSFDYEHTTDKWYAFNAFLANDYSLQFDMYIYNVKFVDAMPTISMHAAVDSSVKDALVQATPTGYKVTAPEITPKYIQDKAEISMDTRKMENVEIEVNLLDKTYSVAFDCYGLHYTDSGKLYI